ncbi:DUF2789 domain-containing protein [Shewanella marisflavi]|uniref:DUF2789 domain-containing protein n=1 Tax=Shewanella marisflavi TaxID=260364 RepID=UPI00200E65B7|nr:DUF2789 domain-containing protein [Shewanella marisflavi]MCL1042027.1 DUF2789 domain-containing protein [Shewanella marisflavi]
MDITPPDLAALFDQLGLSSNPDAIEEFLKQHSIAQGVHIAQAPFWNTAQRHFLAEALAEDAQWTEVIDHLDAQLRA